MCNLMDQSFIYNVYNLVFFVSVYQVTTALVPKMLFQKKQNILVFFLQETPTRLYTHVWIYYVCERCSAIYGSSFGGKCALDVQSVRDDVRNELDM